MRPPTTIDPSRVPASRHGRAVAESLAAIGDPEGTRTMTSIIALLVVIGVALLLVAVWTYRTTRPDPELLAPLEVMGERSWRRRDPVWQRRRLDEVRPTQARPLSKSAAPPDLDEAFEAGPDATGFDDLADPDRAVGQEDGAAVPERHRSSDTPVEVARPVLDLDPDGDFDPEAIAAARAELERELADAEPRESADARPDAADRELGEGSFRSS